MMYESVRLFCFGLVVHVAQIGKKPPLELFCLDGGVFVSGEFCYAQSPHCDSKEKVCIEHVCCGVLWNRWLSRS